jgi:Ca2+-dependent lipid-binding protein
MTQIPGLSSFIRDMTHATLAPVMYDPNVFTLNLEQLLSGAPLDAAIGVVQVTVESARGIKGTKIGGGTPDPYISLSLNNREELAITKYKNNTYVLRPVTFFFTNPFLVTTRLGWRPSSFSSIRSMNLLF